MSPEPLLSAPHILVCTRHTQLPYISQQTGMHTGTPHSSHHTGYTPNNSLCTHTTYVFTCTHIHTPHTSHACRWTHAHTAHYTHTPHKHTSHTSTHHTCAHITHMHSHTCEISEMGLGRALVRAHAGCKGSWEPENLTCLVHLGKNPFLDLSFC